MKNKIIGLAITGAVLLGASTASFAVPLTDVKDYSNNSASEFFVENDAMKGESPYYRGQNGDWGWTHEAISGVSFSSIILDISGYDIDTPDEIDNISIHDGSSWVEMGGLKGIDNTWSFTSFDLSSYSWAATQVNAGLQVRMDIDAASAGWKLTLGKSTLSVDGGNSTCVPTPGVPCGVTGVPAPEGVALLGFCLAGLGFARRKMTKNS